MSTARATESPAAPRLRRLRFGTLSSGVLAALLAGCAVPHQTGGTERGAVLPAEHIVYRCVSGRSVDAAFSRDSAIIRYAGYTHRLGLGISASGARFVGDGLVWWTKGSGPGSHGWLYRAEPGRAAGAMMEDCLWEGRS